MIQLRYVCLSQDEILAFSIPGQDDGTRIDVREPATGPNHGPAILESRFLLP
jgi:hypothetical protein